MRNNLAAGLAHIKEFEGGYVNDPDDPGGVTVWGVAWNRIGRTLGMRKKDFLGMTWEDAAEKVFEPHYFIPAGCEDWPVGIDLVVFDTAVNQGVKASTRFLQRAVKVKADGVIGPVTRGAVKSACRAPDRTRRTMVWFCVWRTAHYTSLQKFWKYGTGWLRRAYTAYGRATELLVESERNPE